MRAPFVNRMSRTQTALGWCYLPVHIVVLPVLLGLYASVSPELGVAGVNLIYYGAGFVFCLTVMFRFLRAGFDAMLDRPGRCVLAIVLALVAEYAMGMLCALLLLALLSAAANPNSAAVMGLAEQNYGAIKALGLFIGPIVEETLFRGVVFGSLRTRSRVLAYLVSTLLFGLYHVWQYAFAYADAAVLLYALQYVPISLALAWCYERTESVWPPVFVHMILNAVSLAALRF